MNASKTITIRLDGDTAAKLDELLERALAAGRDDWRSAPPTRSDIVRTAIRFLWSETYEN